jgi:transcriptional regulator with XRE-family HTH domain
MQGKYALPIRKLVCRARHERGLKQEDVALKLKVDVRSIQYFECVEKLPSLEHLLDYLRLASDEAAVQFLQEVRVLPAPFSLPPAPAPVLVEPPTPVLAQP